MVTFLDNNDKINIDNSVAEIRDAINDKMLKDNPTGTGSFSLNRIPASTIGDYSFAEGLMITASGENSHAEGAYTEATGYTSHAEGRNAIASGDYSHAEGLETQGTGYVSHAEGNKTFANGNYSHAEGIQTYAYGAYSHAEGRETEAGKVDDTLITAAHAEGWRAKAIGNVSHAEGLATTASGNYSHAEGSRTTALANQHAQGHYNNTTTATAGSSSGTTGTAFVIGNGTSTSATSNAFRVQYDGAVYAKAAYNASGADYAEYFEWFDGNPLNEDRRGYFVTLHGNKITIADKYDYVLGIVSGQPSVIGNSDEEWMGRYITDEFGAFIMEEFEYEVTKSNKTVEIKKGMRYKENPNYDNSLPYVQRADRPEWSAVGMLGVLAVRDDGTCEVNGFAEVADGGIATAAEGGYRVIERVSDNVVKIIFK